MERGQAVVRIVGSAAAVIDEHGVIAASLEQVRRGAGVSTGSLYHHFPAGLVQVTDAVYLEVLGRYDTSALERWSHSDGDRARVREMVIQLLTWTQEHPADARRMFQLEDVRGQRPALTQADEDSAFTRAITGWLTEVTAASSDARVVWALWSGPAKEYARTWLRDPSIGAPSAVAGVLADAAWAAVRPHLRSTKPSA